MRTARTTLEFIFKLICLAKIQKQTTSCTISFTSNECVTLQDKGGPFYRQIMHDSTGIRLLQIENMRDKDNNINHVYTNLRITEVVR